MEPITQESSVLSFTKCVEIVKGAELVQGCIDLDFSMDQKVELKESFKEALGTFILHPHH